VAEIPDSYLAGKVQRIDPEVELARFLRDAAPGERAAAERAFRAGYRCCAEEYRPLLMEWERAWSTQMRVTKQLRARVGALLRARERNRRGS
jgi:hypothetical protein